MKETYLVLARAVPGRKKVLANRKKSIVGFRTPHMQHFMLMKNMSLFFVSGVLEGVGCS